MNTVCRLMLCPALVLWAAGVAAKPPPLLVVAGVVSQVDSGDSLTLQPPGQLPVAVRLRDIDVPDPCQAGADESRRALAELALNKQATLRASGRDGHGRTLGTVTVGDVNVGTRMVEEGQAWSIRTRFDHGPLVKQERMAHALGRGLHGAAGAVRPRDFRREHGPCRPAEPASAPSAAPPTRRK